MFGISSLELLIILLVGLMVLGPERLPKVMRVITRLMSEFRKITTELQRAVNLEAHLLEHNEKSRKGPAPVRKDTRPAAPEQTAEATRNDAASASGEKNA
jgi:sec-independent protein translocase protein TatB